jgi:flagellar basal body-associated protein FliL
MKYAIVVILILAAAGAAAYFLVFNKQGAPQPQKPQPQAQKPAAGKPAEKELTEEQKEQLAQQKYSQIESLSKQEATDDRNNQMAQLKQEIIDLVGTTSATAMEAHQLVVQANTQLKEAARRAFENLSSKVKEDFDAEVKKGPKGPEDKEYQYNEILKKIDAYPAKYARTGFLQKLEELKGPIRKAARASAAWEPVRQAANDLYRDKDYKGALAKLEEYPEEFRGSEWESVRQETITEYRNELTKLETEKKKEEALTYYELYSGQPLDKVDWEAKGNWEVKDGVAFGEATAEGNYFSYNYGKDWEDIVLVIRMRLVTGSFVLGVHGTEISEGNLRYDPIKLTTGEMEPNKWYTLTVKLRGVRYTVTAEPPLKYPFEKDGEKVKGPFSFFFDTGSIMHVKSVHVAFFGKIPASFVEEATKQQQDGRAKKLGAGEEDAGEKKEVEKEKKAEEEKKKDEGKEEEKDEEEEESDG